MHRASNRDRKAQDRRRMPDAAQPLAATPAEVLQGALIDSRQRWRELVDLAADFAFETDEWARFTLITPDPALHWAANSLIGQPSATLLAEAGDAVFNPFRVTARVRHREAWVKRGDGGIARMTFSVTPMRDTSGRITGARGVGIEMTELDRQATRTAAALRRSEVMDHILIRASREVVASRMMGATLDGTLDALGAEGVAVIFAATGVAPARAAYLAGAGADAVTEIASGQLLSGDTAPVQSIAAGGRPVLAAACRPGSGETVGLVAWRHPGARAWDDDDRRLVGSLASVVRMVLEREAIQFEMLQQARTDPLTGLLNRRAFLEEIERRAGRQEREDTPATLMFADLDHFKPVNDRFGHEAGDEVLRRTAALLRETFRPTDLIARLGGDEFAIWMDGADHMTAAERAEFLRDAVPRSLAEITGPDLPPVTMSIGIASRYPADGEKLDNLMRRADMAMYEVKRGGRGHWRVSLRKRP
jgi:diguanylate cyclase (GGDEF)-like protein